MSCPFIMRTFSVADSYLIWLTQCASVLLSASSEPMLSLSPGWRDTFVCTDTERGTAEEIKGKPVFVSVS